MFLTRRLERASTLCCPKGALTPLPFLWLLPNLIDSDFAECAVRLESSTLRSALARGRWRKRSQGGRSTLCQAVCVSSLVGWMLFCDCCQAHDGAVARWREAKTCSFCADVVPHASARLHGDSAYAYRCICTAGVTAAAGGVAVPKLPSCRARGGGGSSCGR